MKILDLFSGIGGFSLGLERAGFETVAFCEIDKACHGVLKKHWPKVPIVDDVSKLDGYTLQQTLGRIDIICGGFPCQDVSVAGKKKGLIDESGNATRSGLWFQYKRIIEEVKPKYVIIENVANLRSNGLAVVLKDLWALGYDSEWHIISARSVGTCHLRERVWIIAYPGSQRWEQGASKNLQLKIEKEHGEKSSNTSKKKNTRRSFVYDASNANGNRSEPRVSLQARNERKSLLTGGLGEKRTSQSPNTDNLRLWKPFATEKEKSLWWTEATSSFRDWWKIESPICRMDDGLSNELDTPERVRKERIKQLGNSIVPQIAELIGRSILEFEQGIDHEN